MSATRGRRAPRHHASRLPPPLWGGEMLLLLLLALLLSASTPALCQEIDTGAGVLGEEPAALSEGLVDGEEGEEKNYTLTGIPQIDYVHDPNLPHELIGYDLSDYPFYKRVPAKGHNFTCDGRLDGFYASVPHKCQVYYNCLFGIRYDFLCANYTVFDQANFICHYASEVDCNASERYFDRNEELYVTTSTTTQAPKIIYVDRPRRPRPRPLPGIKTRRPQFNRRRPPPRQELEPVQQSPAPQRQSVDADPAYYDCSNPDYYYDYYDYCDDYQDVTTTTTTTTQRPLRRRGGNRPGGRRPGAGGQGRRRQRPRPGGAPRRKRIRTTTTTTTTAPANYDYYYDDYYDDYYNDYVDSPASTTTTTTQAPEPPPARIRNRGNRRPNFRRPQAANDAPAAASLQSEDPQPQPANRKRGPAPAVDDSQPAPLRRRVVAKPINSRGEIGEQDYNAGADDPPPVLDRQADTPRLRNRSQRPRQGGRRTAAAAPLAAAADEAADASPGDERPPRRRPGSGFGGRRP